MTDEAKDHLCTVRMTATEWARASAVADHHGVNASSVIRMLLKREARELGVEPAAKTTTKKTAK
jgi:antitoxin component of RelBE/YafQ-DinJ toxin-antitoxin module